MPPTCTICQRADIEALNTDLAHHAGDPTSLSIRTIEERYQVAHATLLRHRDHAVHLAEPRSGPSDTIVHDLSEEMPMPSQAPPC
jgi:hypothetical protein